VTRNANKETYDMTNAGFLTGIVAAATVLTIGSVAVHAQGQKMDHGPKMTFQQLDTDGNGEITQEEMQARATARFSEADANGDGLLSLEEMQTRARDQADKRAALMLERFDTDGDGALSADEMPKPRRQGYMFDRVDQDDSGGISEQEFAEAREKMKEHRMGGHGRMMRHGHGAQDQN